VISGRLKDTDSEYGKISFMLKPSSGLGGSGANRTSAISMSSSDPSSSSSSESSGWRISHAGRHPVSLFCAGNLFIQSTDFWRNDSTRRVIRAGLNRIDTSRG
jgi:hypothetical protein